MYRSNVEKKELLVLCDLTDILRKISGWVGRARRFFGLACREHGFEEWM
jgi:hypothetical protein